MALETARGLYDCNGRFAAGRSYIYLFLARDGDGPMYAKIGMSDNPIDRVSSVQVGCPFPIAKAGMVKCLSRQQARLIERAMHTEFCRESVHGEWFKFDWSEKKIRESLMDRFSLVLDERLREWAFQPIDMAVAAAQQRALAASRQQRSRAGRGKRSAAYAAINRAG